MYKSILFSFLLTLNSTVLLANPMQPDPVINQSQSSTKTTVVPKPVIRWPSLDSIIIVGELRKAVFNRTTEIEIGNTISGYQLVAIEKDYVVLQRGKNTKRINLNTIGAVSITPSVEE